MQDQKDEQVGQLNNVENVECGQAADERAQAEQPVQKSKVRLKVKSAVRGGCAPASHHFCC